MKGAMGGRSESWRVELKVNTTIKNGVFKFIDRARPQRLAQSYKYELAAYELSKLLGIDIIPPVIPKAIDGQKGSLQIFMDNCITEDKRRPKKLEPPNPKAFNDALEEINVFENLTYCPREDLGDILIHQNTWRVFRVDFMEAFDPLPELLPDVELSRCSVRLYQGLQKASPKNINITLSPYLNAAEIASLLERRALILKKLESLINDKGRDAVLFGPAQK